LLGRGGFRAASDAYWVHVLSAFAEFIAIETIRQIVHTARLMDGATWRDNATEAIRYWEPRRIFYNLLLVVVAVTTFWLELPSSRAAVTIDSILWLFLLAVVANVAYCTAYIVDLFVQASAFRPQWHQFRWLLYALGSAFAAVLTRYVSMGLFAAVGAGAR